MSDTIKSNNDLIKQYKEVLFQIAGREIELDERMIMFLDNIQRQHEKELVEARINELKQLWNNTQPDTMPEGVKPYDMSDELHKRIAELKGEK